MINIKLIAPNGEKLINPENHILNKILEDFSSDFWLTGSGDLSIDFDNEVIKTSMIVTPQQDLGVYLKYFDQKNQTLLSLKDRSKLGKVVNPGNDWLVSEGLFIANNLAKEAIVEFSRSGENSKEVIWISPDDMPEEGNW
jgi:hypothetical protein